MDLQLLIIVFGFLLIAVFIASGFYRGRHNRTELVRDPRTESAASELSPTMNEVSENIGAVGIIESDTSEVAKNVEESMNKNNQASSSVEPVAQATNFDNEEYNPVPKKSFWGKFKNLFGGKTSSVEVSTDEQNEPQNQYFVSIKALAGKSYLAGDVDAICRQYNLQLRERNIFYHVNDGRTVFGICGNTEPYGFADNDLETVHYSILNIFMDLPDRGFAENNYVEMVSFAYVLVQSLGGEMVNENSQPIGEDIVNKVRNVLAAFDRLA